jgi:exoribonuclease R
MASDTMSLTSNTDKYALSLGVQLNSDGSINASSIILTSSLIHVNYRLTYDQVDEMLDEGVGYTEEWEVGALLAAATKRREHRVQRGSSEGFIPCPIPKGFVTVDKDGQDGGYNIDVRIETTHNSGLNMTVGGVDGGVEHYDPYASPVSSSQLIVTEMMILGEL